MFTSRVCNTVCVRVFEALATLIKDFWLGQSPFKFWKFHSHMPKDGKEKERGEIMEGKGRKAETV